MSIYLNRAFTSKFKSSILTILPAFLSIYQKFWKSQQVYNFAKQITMADKTATDKSKPYFPLAGGANDGWSKEDEATATCFCGAVQLAFVSLTPEFDSSQHDLSHFS